VFSGFRFRCEADPLAGRLGESTERNTQGIGHIKETLNYSAS